MEREYTMGTDNVRRGWRSNEAMQLTFVVTQECNLRCGYCYMVGKNNENKMTSEVAKTAIDYFIDNKVEFFQNDYIILDFIGGEPLLEIDLIDQIVDYFILSTYKKRSPWFGKYRISIGTNGVLYDNEKVQKFVAKNKKMISIGITLDGTKEKHDMHRVYTDGTGSYEDVLRNQKLLMSQGLGGSTKVTIGHEDLPLVKDSIIHLWSLGLKDIPANVVFEDVWEPGDPEIFERQLTELADYIMDNHLWGEYNVTLFSDDLGFKLKDSDLMHSVCGTGKMYCVDANGDIYSCVRFMEYSLNEKPSKKFGNIYEGISKDRMRAFKTLYTKYLSNDECLNCPVDSDCTYCAGYNYDLSQKDSLFDRSTAICEMHKSRVRANNYYWARMYNEHSIIRKTRHKQERFIYFMLSSNCVNYCNYLSNTQIDIHMNPETLIEELKYAFDNFYQPVFIYSEQSRKWLNDMLDSPDYGKALKTEMIRHIIIGIEPFEKENAGNKDTIFVFNEGNSINLTTKLDRPCILVIDSDCIVNLAERVKLLLPYTSRININIRHISDYFDLFEYEQQLNEISNTLASYLKKGEKKEVSKLTDRIFLESMNNCFAGEKNLTLGPDGKFYLCPAFYYDSTFIDTYDMNNIIESTYLKNAPVCNNCDTYQCNRCVYMNVKSTGEFNTPSKIQCEISHIERKISQKLLVDLHDMESFKKIFIPDIDYSDPLEYLEENTNRR